jgi:hypothetical protein
MERSNMKASRGETQLVEEFVTLFKRSGKTEEEAREIMAGVSGAALKNSPEIRKIIDEEVENIRREEEEKISKAKREQERLELLKKLESLKPQVEAAEAEHKKLLEQRDEILKNLDTNQ